MADESNIFLDWLKKSFTHQDIFFNIFNDLPSDFPEEYKEMLNEMCDALAQIPKEFSVEKTRQLRFCAKIANEKKDENFWIILNFVWQLAKKSSTQKKQLAGHKSGNTRKSKKIEIIEKLSIPLEYALSQIPNCRRGDKQVIIQDTLEKYQDTISDVMKNYTKREDESKFFEYYLNQTIELLDSLQKEKSPYQNLIQRRTPRSAASKERSRYGALKRKKK